MLKKLNFSNVVTVTLFKKINLGFLGYICMGSSAHTK
jgi:hypothetical protein